MYSFRLDTIEIIQLPNQASYDALRILMISSSLRNKLSGNENVEKSKTVSLQVYRVSTVQGSRSYSLIVK